MTKSPQSLPVDTVLDAVVEALARNGRCVLQAPPGAGKTTRVPLHLDQAGLFKGRILMLEPRRVAARAAAERLAEQLGETPGGRVGYRMRGDSRRGSRIEVITEGILTRMIQSDPGLSGISCVIFDEFHERALQADLGLALCLEIRAALRDDLAILVMSATLDASPVAALMDDAPVVTSDGRSHPVETHWRATPVDLSRPQAFAAAVAETTQQALADTEGGVLVFLPGVGEIRRVAAALSVPAGVEVLPLHGGLPFREQRRAVLALDGGARKLVLSTAIAETSLTLDGIRTVVDAGRARRMRFDPGKGMARLVTERVTRAEADQRRGRAGRVAPGVCYRLWTKGEEGGLPAFPPPEIASADLAPLMLEIAVWGERDPGALPFLTPPPQAAVDGARALLRTLGAIDPDGAPTPHGRAMASVPAHPRLAHLLLAGGGQDAAALAALIETGDILERNRTLAADLRLRLAALRDVRAFEADTPYRVSRAAHAAARDLVKRYAPHAGPDAGHGPGALLSLAYPDRIALRRAGEAPRYLMSGGAGAVLAAEDPLAGQRMLVAADLDGDRRDARIRLCLPTTEAEMKSVQADQLRDVDVADWSRRARRVEVRSRLMLGALILDDRAWKNALPDATVPALLEGIRDLGVARLPWSDAARALRARVAWLRGAGHGDLPDWSDTALTADLERWLAPYLGGLRTLDAIATLDLGGILKADLGPETARSIDRLAPASLTVPSGRTVAIAYDEETPSLSVRLQELLGLDQHPTIGPGRVPLKVSLLSPAGRPVQTTEDLPGFWRSSYIDVRKDMRGRYPKHDWPEHPWTATATRRPARRG